MPEHTLLSPSLTSHPPAPESAGNGDDSALFARFLAGENSAFLGFFHRHDRSLRLYCSRVLGDGAAAEDVVQETWERVVAMRGEARPVDRPAGLLYRMARNRCIDHLRRARRSISIEEMPAEDEWRMGEGESSGGDMVEAVVEALDALPFEAREVLVLHHYCGYRFDEIAAMLERTPEAIWARASRARKHLRSIASSILEGRSPSTSAPLHRHSAKDHEHLS